MTIEFHTRGAQLGTRVTGVDPSSALDAGTCAMRAGRAGRTSLRPTAELEGGAA